MPRNKITFLGYADKALELGDLTGNRFDITIRNIRKGELDGIKQKAKNISLIGVPNYFDSQRFGSVIGNEFIAKHLIKRNYEKAVKIYLCNIVTQPGQTDNYTASDHIKAIIKYLGEGILDYVLVNNNFPREEIIEKYRKENADIVALDENLEKNNVAVEVADLIENIEQKRVLWEKQDLIRHDPEKLADSICRIYTQ